jgi:hypothetical protein
MIWGGTLICALLDDASGGANHRHRLVAVAAKVRAYRTPE